MTSSSMTFGRPSRLVAPRGSLWAAAIAVGLINLLRRWDQRLLTQKAREPQTAEEVLAWAHEIEAQEPSFAADLRAAAMRSMSKDSR